MNIPGTYELVEERHLPDINADGILLRHKKSGARVCSVLAATSFRLPAISRQASSVAIRSCRSLICSKVIIPDKDTQFSAIFVKNSV